MRRVRRGVIAAGLAGALLSGVPGEGPAHAATHGHRPVKPPPVQLEPTPPAPLPGLPPQPPQPVPMPEMTPPTPPPVPMPHVLPASPRLDAIQPRVELRPPIELHPPDQLR